MAQLETDYLVVGAGESGMAFLDTLIAAADVDVVMVDRRDRPGGHWRDAYPFVRLHNASAIYGVASMPLGEDRIDEHGPNAGFYERATAAQVCDHFDRALDQRLLPSGRVRFLAMTDYVGESPDGHHLRSLVTGRETTVQVRRKLVDATMMEASIPATHTPGFRVEGGARVIPPNDLVNLAEPVSGFTVLGAGKTAMDTCVWLLDAGVDSDAIRWVRPRDVWTVNRECMQPLDLVASLMQTQAAWVEAAAECTDGPDLARHLEAAGVLRRIDPAVEPQVFRGPILSTAELDALRQIEQVVRLGRLQGIGADQVMLEHGTIPTDPGQIHVDCTAAGVRSVPPHPAFEPGRINMQLITAGNLPLSAATLAVVEAHCEDIADQNRLCPPVPFTARTEDLPHQVFQVMQGQAARIMEPTIAEWLNQTRLNPTRAAVERHDDPDIAATSAAVAANFGPALENLQRMLAEV